MGWGLPSAPGHFADEQALLAGPRQLCRLRTRASTIGHVQRGSASSFCNGRECNANRTGLTCCQSASAGGRRLAKITRIGSCERKRGSGEGQRRLPIILHFNYLGRARLAHRRTYEGQT